MNRASNSYRMFSRHDLSAFWALFTDNLTNLIVLSGVCKFVFNMPTEIVFGRIVPGAAVAILAGVLVYTWMAKRLAQKTGRNDITALPYGISTPVMFVYLFGVIGPIYWSTNDATLAWQVGIAAGFIGGIVAAIGAIVGPFLKRVTPRAGMLGTLSGIALVFIGSVSLASIMEEPVIGFTSLVIIVWGLVGKFRLPFNLPAGLAALLVGTAIALASRAGLQGESDWQLMESVGPVPVRVNLSGQQNRASFDVAQLPQVSPSMFSKEDLANVISLKLTDIIGETHHSSCGLPFQVIELTDRQALAQAAADSARWQQVIGDDPNASLYLFCREGERIYARMFGIAVGIAEDPATGSAAAALAGVLALSLSDGAYEVSITQGVEMGRPSQLQLSFQKDAGQVSRVSVGGSAVLMGEGQFNLPEQHEQEITS